MIEKVSFALAGIVLLPLILILLTLGYLFKRANDKQLAKQTYKINFEKR